MCYARLRCLANVDELSFVGQAPKDTTVYARFDLLAQRRRVGLPHANQELFQRILTHREPPLHPS